MRQINDEENRMCREVGKRLSELRKSKKMTQTEAGKHLGITQSNMSQLESDVRKFSVYEIKKLIQLYGSSYEQVLGEIDENSTDEYYCPQKSFKSIDLLLSIVEHAGSDEINKAITAYINLCVYYILRELYETNPRNTDAAFAIDKNKAMERISRFLTDTPTQLSSFIRATNGKIKKTSIEPPLERAADFREFVRTSENYISEFLMD